MFHDDNGSQSSNVNSTYSATINEDNNNDVIVVMVIVVVLQITI